MSRPTVAIRPALAGLNWVVSFNYDRALVAAIKALPQAARRFDKHSSVWRIDASHVRMVIAVAQTEGCTVLMGESVVALGEARNGRLVVGCCPFCREQHLHGLAEGEAGRVAHRSAHCAGRSGDKARAYVILVRSA